MTLNIIKKINNIAKEINHEIVIMELCGTHTEAVAKNGIKKILPKNIKLLSGPGCPVCVTDQKDVDVIIKLALNNIPIACYGDVLRVPGNLVLKSDKGKQNLSLNLARELGADVFEVYSTEDALKLQKEKPNLVFFGVGFDTTTPMTADAIKKGLTVYSSHKLFVPAMQVLVDTPQLKIDGFLNPGHVSTIIGTKPYKKFKLSQVVAGFTGEDVLISIYMLLKQISEGRAEVENEYVRCVRLEGNPIAMKLVDEVFEMGDAFWRGFGNIPNSGLKIRKKYEKFDAKVKYKNILYRNTELVEESVKETGCICGAILRGLRQPKDCKLFNNKCTSENPVGACMVSSEGACGIEAKYLA
ncbi:MAG: hydrogenase formation protein HypD [Patescibacteria group bacterium]|nr:hydrogenase formation protein HypD [Patescibacteria group bacterium]